MKLKDEIQEGDSVSEVTLLDRTFTCSCGHMEVEAWPLNALIVI
jgi:hypothetical protein